MSRSSTPHHNRLQSHQIAEIRRLRAAGCTQSEIKRITGICRTTIHQVLNGKHSALDEKVEPHTQDDSIRYFDGPIERCPSCGRKVHMPCMACRIDSMMANGQLVHSPIQEIDRRQIARSW